MYRAKEGPGFGIWSSSLCAVCRRNTHIYNYIQQRMTVSCSPYPKPLGIEGGPNQIRNLCYGHLGILNPKPGTLNP